MSLTSPTRRDFVRSTTLAGAWIAIGLPTLSMAACDAREAFEAGRPLQSLDEHEAATLDALTAAIFPTTESAGAREAGVVHFVDQVLGSIMEGAGDFVRDGLAEVHAQTVETHGAALAELTGDALISAVSAIEEKQASFFGTVRYLACYGVFGHPKWGGNQDMVGWRLAGIDPQPSYQPPFGYYDREFHVGQEGS